MKSFLLVRHGAPDNPQGLYYGRLEGFPLSPLGRAQSTSAAAILANAQVRCVHASPLQRTRETADIIAHQLGLPVRISARLLEVSTPYDGARIADLSVRGWDLYSDTGPTFEQPSDVSERLRRFMLRHPTSSCVVVTHGDVIAFAILSALSEPLESAAARRLSDLGFPSDYPPPGSITEIIVSAAGEMSLGRKEWTHVNRIEAA